MKTQMLLWWMGLGILGGLMMVGCARERSRTDIALELTDEDSVEAIIDQDLLTAGGTVINVEQETGTGAPPTSVAYVDEIEMQKPVLVESDERLKPPVVATGTVSGLEEPVVETRELTQETESLLAELDVGTLETQVVRGVPGVARAVGVAGTMGETAATGGMGRVGAAGVTEAAAGVAAGPSGTEWEAMAREAAAPALPPAEGGPIAVGTPTGYYPDAYRTPLLTDRYQRHTVVRGDSLWSISRKYGCTVSELAAANGLTRSSVLQIGQVLIVPVAVKTTAGPGTAMHATPAPTVPAATTPPPAAPDAGALPVAERTGAPVDTGIRGTATETYTVQAGDSYWKIARRYGITAEELMALNDTSDSRLQVGQKILVPRR
ncbi:MAG: LysM peptidoglycan-binding domain-containing protein [bacterium]|nr:LysM peptidoglycan-binding domain-containing protein [bacterium]